MEVYVVSLTDEWGEPDGRLEIVKEGSLAKFVKESEFFKIENERGKWVANHKGQKMREEDAVDVLECADLSVEKTFLYE